MTFSQLAYFADIVRLGTFSEAAGENHISQSSLSKQIKALENELGVFLFTREHSRVSLTEHGQIFLSFAEQTLQAQRTVIAALKACTTAQDRHITVGLIPIESTYHISTLIAEFQATLSEAANIDIYEESQQDILTLLDNEVLDLAFIRTEMFTDTASYEIFSYRRERLACICPCNHPFAQRSAIALKDIAPEPIILLDRKSGLHHLGLNELSKQKIVYHISCTVGSHSIILKMISRGLGISLLPQSVLQPEEDDLTAIPLWEDIYSEISIVRKKNRPMSPIKMQFWSFITNRCAIEKEP
ncbi:transcription regulator hth lysr [Lucifera butyrica]|uniref:Transcription regulator hth lysr n=1 Tax=Lucifera butyrica TaxID=1351585 RepID=A0A498R6U3_9FIRM|nr:LysR family transcriptional regulator [Lucifera butyrica]VBB07214.1 transcription regulator hth lysr [Lucifera butyrica]